MTALTSRPATRADVSAIRAIVEAAYGAYGASLPAAPGPLSDDYAALVATGDTWLVLRQNQPLGVLVLKQNPAFLIDNIAVAPDAQGQGIGAQLLDLAERLAIERGHRRMILYTQIAMTRNRAWYRRRGFTEYDRRTEHGIDRVYMEKQLD